MISGNQSGIQSGSNETHRSFPDTYTGSKESRKTSKKVDTTREYHLFTGFRDVSHFASDCAFRATRWRQTHSEQS